MNSKFRILFTLCLVIVTVPFASARKSHDVAIEKIEKKCMATDTWAKNEAKSMGIVIHEPAPDGNDEYEYKETITIHYDYDSRNGENVPFPRRIDVDLNDRGSLYTETYYFDPGGSHDLISMAVSYIEYGNPPESFTSFYFYNGEIIGNKVENGYALQPDAAKKRAAKMLTLFNALSAQMH